MAKMSRKRKVAVGLWVAGVLLYAVPQVVAWCLFGWHYRSFVHWAAFLTLVVVPLFPLFTARADRKAKRKGKELHMMSCIMPPLLLTIILTTAFAITLGLAFPSEKRLPNDDYLYMHYSRFLQEDYVTYAEERLFFFWEDVPAPPLSEEPA